MTTTTAPILKAPFPYFGGKSKIADEVWRRLGDPRNYIEPFAGSAAVLLRRPHAPGVETINDADPYVSNFWRATSTDEGCELVAEHADWPVNEADMHARHRWLVLSEAAAEFRRLMRTDPDYFDPKIAGWWAWGACCWIGSGWCAPHGETADGDRKQTLPSVSHTGGRGLTQQMPMLTGEAGASGRGVHAKRLALGNGGTGGDGSKGVTSTCMSPGSRPELAQAGCGLNAGNSGGRPVITDAFSRGRGVNSNDDLTVCAARRAWLIDWFHRLRDRLRVVRVCCGDWQRVCDSDSTLTRIGGPFVPGKQSGTGVFLDPPYAHSTERMKAIAAELRGDQLPGAGGGLFGSSDLVTPGSDNRNTALYATDNDDVDRLVARVHNWCRVRGDDDRIRIALCGYEGEHDDLEDLGWSVWQWQAQGGYGNRKKASGGENTNKARERVWFSPACLQ